MTRFFNTIIKFSLNFVDMLVAYKKNGIWITVLNLNR